MSLTTTARMKICIDGSRGDGGGQTLRSALALAAITGQAFAMDRIRANRERPGLLRQHLASIAAAKAICGARVEGAETESTELIFEPGETSPGNYSWRIGSGGSTSLILQTVLFPLLHGADPSRLCIDGGTHNGTSPPFEFLALCLRPILVRMGYDFSLSLERNGFLPAGGGRIRAEIKGRTLDRPARLDLSGREVLGMEVHAWSSGIPERIGRAETEIVGKALGIEPKRRRACIVRSVGPGNALAVFVTLRDGKVMFTGVGEPGLAPERVAADCIAQVERYIESGARVDEYLQDQLLLPMSLGAGGRFTTTEPSLHTMANMEIIRKFLAVDFECASLGEDLWEIRVKPGPGKRSP